MPFKDIEKKRASSRKWAKKNREINGDDRRKKNREQMREARKKNPEKFIKRDRDRYPKRREKMIAQKRDRYYNDHDFRKAWLEKVRTWNHLAKYGMTAQEADEFRSRGCAICGSKELPNIDHDHRTGEIRGVLCNLHNRALGVIEKIYLPNKGAFDLYLAGVL